MSFIKMTIVLFLPPIDSKLPIPGFDGYKVDYYGNIYSYKSGRKVKKKTHVSKCGYCSVGLTPNGSTKQQRYAHHIIVAKTWIPNVDNAPTVNHKDRDKQNNSVENLEWMTHSEQIIHSYQNGQKRRFKPVIQADLDGNFIKEFKSIKEASEKTGTPCAGISAVCKKKFSTSGGYVWFYKDDKKRKVRGHSNAKLVVQYTLFNEFIKEYPSCRVASDETGISITSIANAARGKFKTAGKFIWKYKDKAKTIYELLKERVAKWKDIPGFLGYKISKKGEIYSKKSQILLKLSWRGDCYSACLSLNGKSKTMMAHRLVALTYIDNPHNLPCVNHIDGDQSNNRVNNLEWITKKGNSQHAADNGLLFCQKPVNQYSLKGDYIATYKSMTEAGKYLGDKKMGESNL
jgi:HNH endonuclease/NUMOD4 motif/NUMOD1 domain